MTEALSDARYFWLTNVCAFLPDVHRKTLDTFGIDKQVSFYFIRGLFQRRYQYLCSSPQCPSKYVGTDSPFDINSDMTLHEPKDGTGLDLKRTARPSTRWSAVKINFPRSLITLTSSVR